VDPIAELDKKALIIGDEIIKYSNKKHPIEEEKDEKKDGRFNFELVSGEKKNHAQAAVPE